MYVLAEENEGVFCLSFSNMRIGLRLKRSMCIHGMLKVASREESVVPVSVAYSMFLLRQQDFYFLTRLLYPHEVVYLESKKECRSALKLTFCFPTLGVLVLC